MTENEIRSIMQEDLTPGYGFLYNPKKGACAVGRVLLAMGASKEKLDGLATISNALHQTSV